MEYLQKALDALNGLNPQLLATIASVLAIGLELVGRLVKTQKPVSILYVVAKLFNLVGAIFVKVGEILDKVLPQNVVVKEEPKAELPSQAEIK